MPVIAMWMCDRDRSMFDSKKEADAHDKMLELAEQFTSLLESKIDGIDEEQAESFGLLLAKNKELIVQACRGKPEVLSDVSESQEDSNVSQINDAVVA